MLKSNFVVKCTKCGSKDLRMSQEVEYEDEEDKESTLINKVMAHSGYGWELEDFTMTCLTCGGTSFEVKEEKNE